MKILDYLKMFTMFRTDEEVYKQEGWASRRFWGGVFLLVGQVLSTVLGVTLSAANQTNLAIDFTTIAGSIKVIGPACVSAYGIIMGIVGTIKAQSHKDVVKEVINGK